MFDVGAFWFWVLIIVGSILLIIFVEKSYPWMNAIIIIASLWVLDVYGNLALVDWVSSQPGTIIIYILSWLLIGGIWSFIGWWFFTMRARKKYEDLKSKFLTQHNIRGRSIPEDLKQEWREQLALSYVSISDVVPKARTHKKRIITSIIYWPWSFVWGALIKHIWTLIQILLESISSSAFRDINAELPGDDEI